MAHQRPRHPDDRGGGERQPGGADPGPRASRVAHQPVHRQRANEQREVEPSKDRETAHDAERERPRRPGRFVIAKPAEIEPWQEHAEGDGKTGFQTVHAHQHEVRAHRPQEQTKERNATTGPLEQHCVENHGCPDRPTRQQDGGQVDGQHEVRAGQRHDWDEAEQVQRMESVGRRGAIEGEAATADEVGGDAKVVEGVVGIDVVRDQGPVVGKGQRETRGGSEGDEQPDRRAATHQEARVHSRQSYTFLVKNLTAEVDCWGAATT